MNIYKLLEQVEKGCRTHPDIPTPASYRKAAKSILDRQARGPSITLVAWDDSDSVSKDTVTALMREVSTLTFLQAIHDVAPVTECWDYSYRYPVQETELLEEAE